MSPTGGFFAMATQAQDPILAENEAVRQLKEGYKYGWSDATNYVEKPQRGLSHEVIDQISDRKGEPDWMRAYRHKALNYFLARPMPKWGADLTGIDFDNIYYYIKPTNLVKNWEEMPPEIRDTWDKLGIPEAEKSYLGGVSAQYESEAVYHSTKKELEDLGVIFCDMDTALREHEDIVKEYFGTIIPANDNKFAALNSAVWSGGSFIYVPKGVSVEIPLQAYFRINQENMGQFERTMIIVDEGAWVHYVEGCSAPVYSSDSLHSAVVEIIVKPHARCRYTTIQNWSNNVYNLVTQRAVAYDGATRARSNVRCDALILDEESRSDTYPYIEIEEETASIGHEATVSRVGDEQLFYLRSRGIDEAEAMSLIVRGFIEPITKELPLEYAVELNRLIALQMEGSVG